MFCTPVWPHNDLRRELLSARSNKVATFYSKSESKGKCPLYSHPCEGCEQPWRWGRFPAGRDGLGL